QAARLCPGAGSWERIEDVGGGLWRRLHWPKEADWPAAVIPLERPKYRCLAGSGFSLLWKFVGLGAMTESGQGGKMPVSDQVVAGAKADCTPQPLGIFRGFVALPWIGGRPLTVADATKPGVVEHLGRYLAHAAGPPLSLENLDSGTARLAQMLYWNTKESLGEAAAADAAAW